MSYGYQFYNSQGVPFFKDNDRVFMYLGKVTLPISHEFQDPGNNLATQGAIAPLNMGWIVSTPSLNSRPCLIFCRQFSDLSISINHFYDSDGHYKYEAIASGNYAKYWGTNIEFAIYGQLSGSEINTTSGYGIAVFNGSGQPIYSTNHSALQIVDSKFFTTSTFTRNAWGSGEVQGNNRGVLQNISSTNSMSRWWSVPFVDAMGESDFKEQYFAFSFIFVQPTRFQWYFTYRDSESTQNQLTFYRRSLYIASIDPP